jgi:hypothetical protein
MCCCILHAGGKLPLLQVAPGVQSTLGPQVEFLYGTTCLGHNFTQVSRVSSAVQHVSALPSMIRAPGTALSALRNCCTALRCLIIPGISKVCILHCGVIHC